MTAALLIWWTCHEDCRKIEQWKARFPGSTPHYIIEQFRSRVGRAGRGRLWADKRFGDVAVEPWPANETARKIENVTYGGVVIRRDELRYIKGLPGFVTDMNLNVVEAE